MELKNGYQKTEIGVIPEEWKVIPLNLLTSTVASGQSKHSKPYGTFPIHGSTGIIGYTEWPEYQGDAILVARVGANAGKLNVVCGEYGVTDNTIIVRVNSGISLPFIWRSLEAKKLNSLVFGSGQPLITGSQLKALLFALPSSNEQQAITAALSDTDALLEGISKLITKKRDIKQATMQQLLTGKSRLPGFSGDLIERKLGDIAIIKDGTHQTPKYVSSGVPFFSVEHVTSGNFVNTKFISEAEHRFLTRSFKIEKGDILMTRIGSIGVCKLVDWDFDASFYVSLALLKIKQSCSPAYIAHYSKSTAFINEVELNSLPSAIPKKINLGAISNIKVKLPTTLAEQTAIAQVLSDMDNEIDALEKRLEKTRMLKQGMMQELLTGRIRLV
ncbi:hypothetical protein CBP51_13470 [Cellvibrio mixtus]|uniref:Type I restriction modification DNA specificity domain-containing protein n=1 Tax=Cellvibrio mixtus TaxID=39650 RepID=A0A266Q2Y5_9GAMM|nr:restriction endonuclease subunit S [Cellvibrio mixtus]OZY84233.1 hypothetical protein CBP51_13470 [Cellvibrio mixtus]